MKQTTYFVTGTDTGVGKTVLTALLAGYLGENGIKAAALKPVCSGGRDDALMLHNALNGALTLDEINPWHFRAPIAPLLAARQEQRRVKLSQVVAHVRALQRRFDVLLIEGAGGLLSPLGENFDSRDLLASLRAIPIVVCPNRLGALNQALLNLEALPHSVAAKARVILVSPPRPDAATKTNAGLLAEYFDEKRIFSLPWLSGPLDFEGRLKNLRLQKTLQRLTSEV